MQSTDGEHPLERLQNYLDRVCLSARADDLQAEEEADPHDNHLAKGLEYKVVFVVGMVEGVFLTPDRPP